MVASSVVSPVIVCIWIVASRSKLRAGVTRVGAEAFGTSLAVCHSSKMVEVLAVVDS